MLLLSATAGDAISMVLKIIARVLSSCAELVSPDMTWPSEDTSLITHSNEGYLQPYKYEKNC